MPSVTRTDEFIRWLKNLRDIRARAKIVQRIDRLALGNPETQLQLDKASANFASTTAPAIAFTSFSAATNSCCFSAAEKNSQTSDIAFAKKLASELED